MTEFPFPLNNVALARNICKHNSHFSFFHHTERERSASYRNEMKLLHLKRRFYEARLTAYEAALRAMKRTFGA